MDQVELENRQISDNLRKLEEKNDILEERIREAEGLNEFIESKYKEAQAKIEELNKNKESLIISFNDELEEEKKLT